MEGRNFGDDQNLLFLDFDGVVCDSLSECLVSSWIAYRRSTDQEIPAAVPMALRSHFVAMRSLIRSGKDYVLIQDLIARNRPVTSQTEFDSHIQTAGVQTMQRFKTLFYEARSQLLDIDPDYWMSLNRIYPHMLDGLRAVSGSDLLYVISTKKAAFIARLLISNGVPFDTSRIIYSGSTRKLSIISSVLDTLKTLKHRKAVLVDDQIDHLLGNTDPRIQCLLATWGFIKKEWLNQAETVDPTEMAWLLKRLCRGSYPSRQEGCSPSPRPPRPSRNP